MKELMMICVENMKIETLARRIIIVNLFPVFKKIVQIFVYQIKRVIVMIVQISLNIVH